MIPLIYALKTGNLENFEQMALATLDGLRDEFTPYILAPKGAFLKEAKKNNFIALPFSNSSEFLLRLRLILSTDTEAGFVTNDVSLSQSLLWLNFFYRRRITHIHLVGEENLDSPKRYKLNKHDVTFVAQSKNIKQKLIAQSVRHEKIRVIETFLTDKIKEKAPRHRTFTEGIKKVAVISDIEADKKIEVLLDALKLSPALESIKFTIYGKGSRFEELNNTALRRFPNVEFAGECENVAEALAESDLYLHLCGDETTNLTILRAMAAEIPILIAQGEGEPIITNNINGFSFNADDPADLAIRLKELADASPNMLNAVTKGGKYLLNIRFSPESGVERYRRLLNEPKVPNIDMTRGKVIL